MRPTFIQLTLLSGLHTYISLQHIISLTRIGKATYVRCCDDFPNPEATNNVRCVMETPEEILELLGALAHSKPDQDNLPNN